VTDEHDARLAAHEKETARLQRRWERRRQIADLAYLLLVAALGVIYIWQTLH
jgi:hypothetical protein